MDIHSPAQYPEPEPNTQIYDSIEQTPSDLLSKQICDARVSHVGLHATSDLSSEPKKPQSMGARRSASVMYAFLTPNWEPKTQKSAA